LRLNERLTPTHHSICETERSRFVSVNGSPCQNHIQRAAVANESWQPDSATIYEWHPPSPAEYSKNRGFGGDPQITPQGQFKAASYRVAFHGSNDRFVQQHPTHAKRPLSLRLVHFVEISFGCELQVISRTEGFTDAAKDSGALRGVRFKL
jgi:hypothetical protein